MTAPNVVRLIPRARALPPPITIRAFPDERRDWSPLYEFLFGLGAFVFFLFVFGILP